MRVILALLIVFAFGLYQNVDAAKIDAIGITISKSCQLSERCVSYKDIKYLDNSPSMIGKLNHDGIRKSTPKQDNPEWLRFAGKNQTIIITDPPAKVFNYIKQIEIVSELKQYFSHGQYRITEYNQTKDMKPTHILREYHQMRWVDDHCTRAVISAQNWKPLLEDTINYLKSKCQDTMIDTLVKDIKPLTKHKISDSYKYKLEKWQDHIKKNCLKTRNACTDLAQPIGAT